MKKTNTAFVLGTSRSNGHTRQVLDVLRKHYAFDLFDLNDFDIHPYDYEYQHTGDDFLSLIEQLMSFDAWGLATPIYWYSMSAQLKTFIDRFSDLVRIRKDLGRQLAEKKLYALSCGSDHHVPIGFFEPFQLTAQYLDMVYGGDIHTWKASNQELEPEVLQRIGFMGELLKS